jgi:hypothetical protein
VSRDVCPCGRELEHGSCPDPACGGGRRDPKPGEVWRSRDKREPGRTVRIVENAGPGGFVKIRTLTRGDGTPMVRWINSRVRYELFHQHYTFEREGS